MQNELLALAYDEVNPSKAARLRGCATYLEYKITPEGNRLHNANFCRVRLCPVCQWRRSLKSYSQTSKIIRAYEAEKEHSYALLTLTVRNCTGEEVGAQIDALMKAWDRLSRRARWRKAVLGWYRGLEITHNVNINSPVYGTYHPHFHVLLALRKHYFTSKDYIRQAEWTEMWQHALRVDYLPIVDIRRIKMDKAGAIAEVSKYCTKYADYIIPDDWDLTCETVGILDRALDGRRFVAYGGALADWHRKLNLGEPDEGDLVHVEDDDSTAAATAAEIAYIWYSGYKQYYGGGDNK